MHWQDACAKGVNGIALRYDVHLRRMVFRRADGSAWYARNGQPHDARPEDVDGYTDWEPNGVKTASPASRSEATPPRRP